MGRVSGKIAFVTGTVGGTGVLSLTLANLPVAGGASAIG
jgi:hypothetical protein